MSRAWEPNAIGSVVPPFGGGGGGGGGGITQLTQDVLAGPGAGSQPATVVGLQGNPVSNAAPSAGQALVWNGAQWAPATVPQSPFYPAIDANTILAWDFTGTAASIPNLGTLGAGAADMSSIGASVIRDVPGPVNTGVGVYGTAAGSQVYTSQGAVNLGSASFVNEITMVAFIDLTTDPAAIGGEYNALVKGRANGVWGAPVETAIGWFAGQFFGQVIVIGGGIRQAVAPTAYGFRPGLHMVAYTYDGTTGTSRLYFDGVQVASAVQAAATIELGLVIGVNEGPWNVGGNFVTNDRGMRGVVYAARVHNVVKDATWMSQAWRDANGWP